MSREATEAALDDDEEVTAGLARFLAAETIELAPRPCRDRPARRVAALVARRLVPRATAPTS